MDSARDPFAKDAIALLGGPSAGIAVLRGARNLRRADVEPPGRAQPTIVLDESFIALATAGAPW